MFGRRNNDSFSPPAAKPTEEIINLDMLPDLPELPGSNNGTAVAETRAEESVFERPWHAEEPVNTAYQPTIPTATPFVPTAPPASAPFVSSASTSNAAPARAKSSVESVIGPDDFFDGNYRSERGVRLQGTVRGSIESRQYIFVESGATVEANLSAEDITVSGEFSGTIECRHRLEVTSTGQVRGQVTTALLVVQEGGLIDGELHMRRENQNG